VTPDIRVRRLLAVLAEHRVRAALTDCITGTR
jgi:hypothetical protein